MKGALQRDCFIDEIFIAAKKDKSIYFLSADLGAKALDRFRLELPEQFIHVGISEQNMIDVAAGLALDGKNVFCYAMAPFVTFRCFEQIKVALAHMKLPVTLVGVGVGYGYDDAGPTHYATEDIACMSSLVGMEIYTPADNKTIRELAQLCVQQRGLRYIRLDRKFLPDVSEGQNYFSPEGYNQIFEGSHYALVASGYMLHQALKIREKFLGEGKNFAVIDLFRCWPLAKSLKELLSLYSDIFVLEEHFKNGGLGSLLLGFCADHKLLKNVYRLGIEDHYYFENGGREYIHQLAKIDEISLYQKIKAEIS